MMTNPNDLLFKEISTLYDWIDQTLASHKEQAGLCNACGKCCNFEAYGHRLYVTHAEMLFFLEKMGIENIQAMSSNQCPYMIDNLCTVHKLRFSGCRIFCCQGNEIFQNDLSEQAIAKLKKLSDKYSIPYKYMDLRESLNNIIP